MLKAARHAPRIGLSAGGHGRHDDGAQVLIEFVWGHDDARPGLLDLAPHGRVESHQVNIARLRSVPGIGKVLALTILYEIHDITRFDRVQEFASYARLVKCQKQSGGKTFGTSGAKMGNVHLKWAFSEAAVLFLRHTEGKKLIARIETQHGKGKALSILAHTIGRAVFYMLSRGTVFSMDKFLAA